ncbi:MAG: hypothetical protein KF779_01225 [Hyphomonadaceae bacterium]|nr:hypothetical protein [Hyphomonadaceae bacterium]
MTLCAASPNWVADSEPARAVAVGLGVQIGDHRTAFVLIGVDTGEAG